MKIEELLQHMPKATMNTQVKQQVYESLMLKKEETKKPRFSFPLFGFTPRSFAFACAVLVLIIGGAVMVKNSINPLRPSSVSAAEILKRNIANFFRPNTIYHVTYKHFVDYKGHGNTQPTVYDLWEDRNSDRFYQEITYPDGNRSWQGFDTNTSWTIDFNEKTVMEDLYVWTNPAEKEVKHGDRVDMSAQFDELITNGQLEAKEGLLDTKPVYIVYDTRKSPDKLWDILTFDKDSFALLQTETKNATGDGVGQLVLYEKQEVLDRTPENLEKLFAYRSPGEGFTVLTRHFDPNNGGYVESEYQQSTPSPTPTPTTTTDPTADWKTYTDPILKFSIQYPNDMTLEKMNNDIYLSLVSFKNNNTQFSVYVRESDVENEVKLIRAQTEGHVVTALVKNEAFQINGVNGWLLEYTPQSGNINRSTVIIPNKTNVYVINAQSDVFDQILSTFMFVQ